MNQPTTTAVTGRLRASGVGRYFAPVPGHVDQILSHRERDQLVVFDLSSSSTLGSIQLLLPQRQLVFLDDHRALGLSERRGDALRIWDVKSGQMLWEQKDTRLNDKLAITPDGRYAVTTAVEAINGKLGTSDKLLLWRLPQAEAPEQAGADKK